MTAAPPPPLFSILIFSSCHLDFHTCDDDDDDSVDVVANDDDDSFDKAENDDGDEGNV